MSHYPLPGGSHDRTDLLPLKAGVSLMALGAMADHPEVKVRIVPVGLSYFHAHRFRSRAVVEFGTALDVPEELIELYKQGGAEKRDAVAKLLDLIYDGLKTVTIRAPDYDTLMVCGIVTPKSFCDVMLSPTSCPAYTGSSSSVQDIGSTSHSRPGC